MKLNSGALSSISPAEQICLKCCLNDAVHRSSLRSISSLFQACSAATEKAQKKLCYQYVNNQHVRCTLMLPRCDTTTRNITKARTRQGDSSISVDYEIIAAVVHNAVGNGCSRSLRASHQITHNAHYNVK